LPFVTSLRNNGGKGRIRNTEQEWEYGTISASTRAGGASGTDQDGDELVGLALDRWLDAQQGVCVPHSRSHSVFRIRPFPPLFLRE